MVPWSRTKVLLGKGVLPPGIWREVELADGVEVEVGVEEAEEAVELAVGLLMIIPPPPPPELPVC